MMPQVKEVCGLEKDVSAPCHTVQLGQTHGLEPEGQTLLTGAAMLIDSVGMCLIMDLIGNSGRPDYSSKGG